MRLQPYNNPKMKQLFLKDAIVLRLQSLCRQQHISINELATRSGVTPSTVYSLMLPTRRELSVTTVKKLLDGLDISVRDFFDDAVFDSLELEIQ